MGHRLWPNDGLGNRWSGFVKTRSRSAFRRLKLMNGDVPCSGIIVASPTVTMHHNPRATPKFLIKPPAWSPPIVRGF